VARKVKIKNSLVYGIKDWRDIYLFPTFTPIADKNHRLILTHTNNPTKRFKLVDIVGVPGILNFGEVEYKESIKLFKALKS